ncbi:LON peptidase substrate-binding domain-containing protein [soil metagenome]
MFPLGSVLLPGMILPLHVFEERYRALVRHCLDDEAPFGVVLIERGSEVGGGDVRSDVGTLAQVMRAEETPDGRWGVIAVGTERLRIDGWLADDPYPQARVEAWPDEPPTDLTPLAERYATQVSALRRVLAMAAEMGASVDAIVELPDDPLAGSHHLAALAPVGALDRQRLLAAPGPERRVEVFAELIDDVAATLEAQLAGG